MLTLPVTQCPRCVLRFGSKSEMHQHLRLDHRPAPEPPTAQAAPAETTPDEPTPEPAAPGDVVDRNRLVIHAIATAAVLALVAVLSWHLAAVLSVVLVATAAVRGWMNTRTETAWEQR